MGIKNPEVLYRLFSKPEEPVKDKEIKKWLDCFFEFNENPPDDKYYEEAAHLIVAILFNIVDSKYGPVDDFSIEKLYKEYVSMKQDETKTEMEKIKHLHDKFTKKL